jgi:acetyl esterase/lipase
MISMRSCRSRCLRSIAARSAGSGTLRLQQYLRWRNANAHHPDVRAAQRRERARIRNERHHGWGRPRPKARVNIEPANVLGQRTLRGRLVPKPDGSVGGGGVRMYGRRAEQDKLWARMEPTLKEMAGTHLDPAGTIRSVLGTGVSPCAVVAAQRETLKGTLTMSEVRTAAGALRGRREAGVAVFRGIPFAEAPVGELRFAAPRPVRGWDGVRAAVSYGPPPPQPDAFGRDEVSRGAAGDDWLTVNVWSPDPDPGAKLPVMVWVHGGAYTIGMSSSPEYDGRRLSRDGGVVVVTFNYRVGVEGFAQIAGALSNRGLLDQIAALEWVHDNIQVFGGDPGRITVFGESAGAGSVAALLAMPRAAGLFRRAVAQSVPGTFFSTELAADIATACADELGLRPTAAELATVDPARLVAAGDTVAATMTERAPRWGQVAHWSILFAPVVDGEVLPVIP